MVLAPVTILAPRLRDVPCSERRMDALAMKPLIIKVAALTLFAGGVARADYAQEVLKDSPVAW